MLKIKVPAGGTYLNSQGPWILFLYTRDNFSYECNFHEFIIISENHKQYLYFMDNFDDDYFL